MTVDKCSVEPSPHKRQQDTEIQDQIVHIDKRFFGACCHAEHIKAVCSCCRVACVLAALSPDHLF